MHTIFSIDPGVTTGVCLGLLEDRDLKLKLSEMTMTPREMYDWLEDIMGLVEPPHQVHIVYEDFNYRNVARAGLDLTPVKLIGVIEVFRERHEPIVTFTKQTAATGKAYFTDDKLKRLGIYVKGKKHGRDAMRHLLQWYTFGPGSQYGNVDATRLVTM